MGRGGRRGVSSGVLAAAVCRMGEHICGLASHAQSTCQAGSQLLDRSRWQAAGEAVPRREYWSQGHSKHCSTRERVREARPPLHLLQRQAERLGAHGLLAGALLLDLLLGLLLVAPANRNSIHASASQHANELIESALLLSLFLLGLLHPLASSTSSHPLQRGGGSMHQ